MATAERQESHTSSTSTVDNTKTTGTRSRPPSKKNGRKGQNEGSSASKEVANEKNSRPFHSTRKAHNRMTSKTDAQTAPQPSEDAATGNRDGHSGNFRHWDRRGLQRALKRGSLFRGKLRFNASNRDQAYVTLSGLPADVLIKGSELQGHALEGDEVAIQILPRSMWYFHGSMRTPPSQGKSRPKSEISSPYLKHNNDRDDKGAQHQAATVTGKHDDRIHMPISYPQPVAMCHDDTNPTLEIKTPERQSDADAEIDLSHRLETMLALESSDQAAESNAHAKTKHIQKADVSHKPGDHVAKKHGYLATIAEQLRSQPSLRATARVVAILEPAVQRERLSGTLRADPAVPQGFRFIPSAMVYPPMTLCGLGLPRAVRRALAGASTNNNSEILVMTRVLLKQWDKQNNCHVVQVLGLIGKAGELAAESLASLSSWGIEDATGFDAKVLDCLPSTPWRIDEEEIRKRRDLRSTRVFSIDPPTARDLDDALSIERLPDLDQWRVGVHIADVSHFVRPGTALDDEALQRSTSVYLPDRVIPMLPRLLCEELCSLSSGTDRLAVSVMWDIDDDGVIRSKWLGRTIIHSCAKLSYLHAQAFIEGHMDLSRTGLPSFPISKAQSLHDIRSDCLALHKLACVLRKKRFDNGALRLDNTKLSFVLDAQGHPINLKIEVQQEANRLVEEFMLLANITMADTIADAFPGCALLRCHPSPAQEALRLLSERLHAVGINLDVTSAGTIQNSLLRLRQTCPDPAIAATVTQMTTKPMQTAMYISTGDHKDETTWRHYALAVARYTHFTSPIRRYPDIIVHRLLAAALRRDQTVEEALGWKPAKKKNNDAGSSSSAHHRPQESADSPSRWLSRVAGHANERKGASKAVQDSVLRLYLLQVLSEQPRVCMAVVTAIGGPRYFDVYLPSIGQEARLQTSEILTALNLPVKAQWDGVDRILRLTEVPVALTSWSLARTEHTLKPIVEPDVMPVRFPLTLHLLSKIPLVVTVARNEAGSPIGITGHLWLA